MRPRVQWALFCRDLTVDQRGLTTVSDLVHVLPVQSASARLWLVASIEGEPNGSVLLTLRLGLSGMPAIALPAQSLTFGLDGFAELKAQLPPVPLFNAGTFSVDLSFADDLHPAERVAVKIATSSDPVGPRRTS